MKMEVFAHSPASVIQSQRDHSTRFRGSGSRRAWPLFSSALALDSGGATRGQMISFVRRQSHSRSRRLRHHRPQHPQLLGGTTDGADSGVASPSSHAPANALLQLPPLTTEFEAIPLAHEDNKHLPWSPDNPMAAGWTPAASSDTIERPPGDNASDNRPAAVDNETIAEQAEQEKAMLRWVEMVSRQGKDDELLRQTWLGSVWSNLLALAGGTGFTMDLLLRRDSLRSDRMIIQDEAVLFLLIGLYLNALLLSGVLAYRQARNDSRVQFYADPRVDGSVSHTFNMADFLEAFNQPPKNVYVRVSGYTHAPLHAPGCFSWRGLNYNLAFSFCLDISPWLVRATTDGDRLPLRHSARNTASGSSSGGRKEAGSSDRRKVQSSRKSSIPWCAGERLRKDGVVGSDADKLCDFLSKTAKSNELAYVDMQKHVSWTGWEELATNIKMIIHHRGFDGLVWVDCTDGVSLPVHQNTQWANFMHSRALKVILAFSIIGFLLYIPYMGLRCIRLPVRTLHKVNINVTDYWHLIVEQLGRHGFSHDAQDGVSAFVHNATMPAARIAANPVVSGAIDPESAPESRIPNADGPRDRTTFTPDPLHSRESGPSGCAPPRNEGASADSH